MNKEEIRKDDNYWKGYIQKQMKLFLQRYCLKLNKEGYYGEF